MKFKLHDLRESKVWKEAHDEGETELKLKLVEKWLAKGLTQAEIADLLEIPVEEVKSLATNHSH